MDNSKPLHLIVTFPDFKMKINVLTITIGKLEQSVAICMAQTEYTEYS